MAKFNKHQGESLAFKRGLQIDGVDENLATDWTCRLVVKSFPDDLTGVAVLDKAISELGDSDTRFIVRITPAEMTAIPVGEYFLITEMNNAVSEINDESQDRLTVTEQGAS